MKYIIHLILSLIIKRIISTIDFNEFFFDYLIETTLINLHSNKETTSAVGLFDYGFVAFDSYDEKIIEGIEENTDFIIDNNRNVFFGCLQNYFLIKYNASNYNLQFGQKNNFNNNDNLLKCSLSFYTYVNEEEKNQSSIILTRSVYNNKKYYNYFYIYNYSLDLVFNTNFTTMENYYINFKNIFQCITLLNYTKIFCAYAEDKVYGGFFNEKLNAFISIKTLFDTENNNLKDFINFKIYEFSNETFFIVFQKFDYSLLVLKKYDINDSEDNFKIITILTLNSNNQVTIEQFQLIKYTEESILISILNNENFEIYFLRIPNSSSSNIYYDKLIVSEGNIKKIEFVKTAIFEQKKIIMLAYLNDNTIHFSELYFPNNPLVCSPLILNLTSDNSGTFNLNDIIIETSEINSNYIKLTKLTSENIIIETSDYESFTYNIGSHGSLYSQIYYDFSNENYKIEYFGNLCYLKINVCNEACENCDNYSNEEYNTQCKNCLNYLYYPYFNDKSQCFNYQKVYNNIFFDFNDNTFKNCDSTCLTCYNEKSNCTKCNPNYFPSMEKKNFCNICEEKYNSIWYFDEEMSKGICLYNYNYCEEASSIIDKPYMIYNTFECVEGCSSNLFFFYNLCLNNCDKENMSSIGNKCYCLNGFKYYLNKTNLEIFCVENCPSEYPYYIKSNNECVSNCPNIYSLIYNNTCLKKCPFLTHYNNNINDCECDYYTYKEDNKIYCTNSFNCPDNFPYLNNNICLKKCPNFSSGNLCVDKCESDYLKIKNHCLSLNEIINNSHMIIEENFNGYFYAKGKNYSILLYDTSEKGINFAKDINNVSKIDFGNCINILKESYNENIKLFLLQIDIYRENEATNQVEYEIYDSKGKKLDLDLCSKMNITLELPLNFSSKIIEKHKILSLIKNHFDIFNGNDSFYNNFCSEFTTEYKTDIIISDRRIYYYQNITLCEDNCNYIGFNYDNLNIKCSCLIKNKMNTEISNFKYNNVNNIFLKNSGRASLKVFKCYKTVFNIKNTFHNSGNIFMSLLIIFQIILLGFYIKNGINNIVNKISTIIKTKNTTLIKTLKDINFQLNDNSLSYNKEKKIIGNPPKKKINKKNTKNSINRNLSPHIRRKYHSNSNKNNTYNKLCVLKYVKQVKINSHSNTSLNQINSNKPIVYNNNFISYINYSGKNYEKRNNFSNSDSNFLKYDGDTNVTNSNPLEKNIEKLFFEKNNTKRTKKENKQIDSPKLNLENNNNDNNTNNNDNDNENIIKDNSLQIKISLDEKRNKKKKKNLNKTELIPNKSNKNNILNNSNLPQIPIAYTNEEIDLMGYKMALKYDKMSFLKYYWLILKYDQLILFTFYTHKDYNLRLIKYSLFIFSISLYLFVSAIFFSNNSFHYIYEKKGQFEFFYILPKSILSSFFCAMINILLQKLALSQKIIEKIKLKNSYHAEKTIEKMKKRIKIQLAFFYIILFIFMFFIWYYISCFCGIYKNTQNKLFKKALITFVISMLFPFIFCVFTALTRKIALKKKSRILFKVSKFLHHF